MNLEGLVARLEDLLGWDHSEVERDDDAAFTVRVWFNSPTDVPLFAVTVFSGDGIHWKVGGLPTALESVRFKLATLHEGNNG